MSPLSRKRSGKSDLAEENYWRDRLFARRYRFPALHDTGHELSVKIDYEGIGYWFPLGTADTQLAIEAARRIDAVIRKGGWGAACRRFPRELIIGFEWCSNPILWTYTTVHTLVTEAAVRGVAPLRPVDGSHRVLLVESDAGIRRALQWCVAQQPGFQCVTCDSPGACASAIAANKPQLVLLNRNLAERAGFATPGRIANIQGNTPALTYSVAVDGDQLFVSTPGGADGYLLKRVKPTGLLEPMLAVSGTVAGSVNEIDRSVKEYFKNALLPRAKEMTGAIARLTAREREVLALLSKGCVDKEIAGALGISAWTVHGHIKKIFERLGVRTRTEAVVRYLEK